jgi:hypothetical protein
MSSGSSVPSAAQLARTCYDIYRLRVSPELPEACAWNLELLTSILLDRTELDHPFVSSLVDWQPFGGDPNDGHRAIADLLVCKAFEFGITTNIDALIEMAAHELGENDLGCALDGDEMNLPNARLLKIHGCCRKNKYQIVWTHDQLSGPKKVVKLVDGLTRSANWLRAILPNRDLLILGFWSDWHYLNDVLIEKLGERNDRLVVLIDKAASSDLELKAPELWSWASSHENFKHVQMDGAEFLDYLRREFSSKLLNALLFGAKDEFKQRFGSDFSGNEEFGGLTSAEYYELRRDASGKAPPGAAPDKNPSPEMMTTGVCHLWLRSVGGVLDGLRYRMPDKSLVRVINGLGRVMSYVQKRYARSPDAESDYLIVVGGADDGGASPDIVRGQQPNTFVRRASKGEWLPDTAAYARNWS